jgi:hypothetical protein
MKDPKMPRSAQFRSDSGSVRRDHRPRTAINAAVQAAQGVDEAPDPERLKWNPTEAQFAAYQKRERELAVFNLKVLNRQTAGRACPIDTLQHHWNFPSSAFPSFEAPRFSAEPNPHYPQCVCSKCGPKPQQSQQKKDGKEKGS